MHARPRRAVVALITAVASVVTSVAFFALAPVPSAQAAANAIDFDPSDIVSDAVFFDWTTMSASDIQVFLSQKGATCQPGSDGTPCLKDFRQDTTTRSATDRCPGGYAGATGESAATIIAKVAQSCGINPQAIIVILQKEQGLVTASGSGLFASRYRSAMGYGCPDSAACDSTYYGFFNQVYSAASQFRNYALNPTRYSYRAGVVNTIAYSPTTGCGSSQVLIQNQATAGLYDYTPYQPNAAALAAGYNASSDPCASYGNRNFYLYFTDWFGPTTQRAPIGVVDSVWASDRGVTANGWAFDPDTTAPIVVHVYVDGRDVSAAWTSISRPDVAAVYKKGDLHGYSIFAPAAPGTHRVCVYAVDSAGLFAPEIGCRTVTVIDRPPLGVVDSATVAGGQLTVRGWAFDPDTTGPIVVHVYVDGRDVAASWTDISRPDVAAVYGNGDLHGYSIAAAASGGPHRICVYAVDTAGVYAPEIGCQMVNVVNRQPIGVVDSATVAGGQLTVTGWAFDPDTTASIGVHFYVDGTWTTATTAALSRPDVAAVYGMGPLHGYGITIPTTPGPHRVCAYAIDATGGVNPEIGCASFVGPDPGALARGAVENLTLNTTTATATGWALDPDTTAPIQVRAYVDGVLTGSTIAAASRPDIAATYSDGDLHGYTFAFIVPPGTHTACVRGVDANAGVESDLGCKTVTVAANAANRAPTGVIDWATASGGQLTVAGWAFDPDTSMSIDVRFTIDGTPAGDGLAAGLRPDVDAVYGDGAAHGYTIPLATPAGAHTVCLFGVDPATGTAAKLACTGYTAG